jgi:tetratricopeptide (TPR) repeat protein
MTASNLAQWLKQAARGNMTIPELFDAAAALTQQGQPQSAIDLYRTWIEHTKRSPLAYAAWFNLGALLAAVNDDDGAEAAYRKCIALQARFIEGRLNLGTLLERAASRRKRWTCGAPSSARRSRSTRCNSARCTSRP